MFKNRRILKKLRLMKQLARKKYYTKYGSVHNINIRSIKFLKKMKIKSTNANLNSRNHQTTPQAYAEFINNFLT